MDPREKEALEHALLRAVKNAQAAYNEASKDHRSLMEQCKCLGLLNPDGAMALEKATKLQQMAYEKWKRALLAFSGLVVDGREPKLSPHDQGLLLNLGLVHVKRERYAEALPLFAEVVQTAPDNTQAQELLATCQLHNGQAEPAAKILEALRFRDPRNAGVLYLLGAAYFQLKQPEKARQALDEMISSIASPAQASFLMGKAYYDGGRSGEATESFRAVVTHLEEARKLKGSRFVNIMGRRALG